MVLQKFSTVLLDGDGVLWKSNQPIPGIKPFFIILHNPGIKWALLTNNNTRTVEEYIDKLDKFGIPLGDNFVFTSSTATVDYVLKHYGKGTSLHVVGMDGLISTLLEAGFDITFGENIPSKKVAAVVAGMDRQINHDKIKIAMRLILDGADFVATNTDGSYPSPEGINPGTGMVIGALQATSGVEPYVAGKPHSAIFKTALEHLQVNPENTLMIGDRLETDILGASSLGISTAAVLTGVTSWEEIKDSPIQPDFIFEDISQIHLELEKAFRV